MQYDPSAKSEDKMLKSLQCANSSDEDCSISVTLKSGYYLIYSYIDLDHCSLKSKITSYTVKVDCESLFKCCKVNEDLRENDFPILRKMMIQSVLENNEEFKESEKFTSFLTNYKSSGISHRIIYNPSDKANKYSENIENLKNVFILSPYNSSSDNKEIEWYINPKSFNCILGMDIDSTEKSTFTLKAKVYNVSNHKGENDDLTKFNLNEYCNDNVMNENNKDIKKYYDFTSISLEQAQEELLFESIDMNEMTLNDVKKQEPTYMEKLLKLDPTKNDKDLSWTIKKTKNQKYIGQSNKNRKKEGRGMVVTSTSNMIGYFEGDQANGHFIIYDSNFENKTFEGEYKDGKRNGYGVITFNNGDSFEGNFVDGLKSGQGKYIYKSGAVWEGPFENDKMNGEGTYSLKGKSKKVTYVNGVMQKSKK